jgi:hypothetical protein
MAYSSVRFRAGSKYRSSTNLLPVTNIVSITIFELIVGNDFISAVCKHCQQVVCAVKAGV